MPEVPAGDGLCAERVYFLFWLRQEQLLDQVWTVFVEWSLLGTEQHLMQHSLTNTTFFCTLKFITQTNIYKMSLTFKIQLTVSQVEGSISLLWT